MRTLAVDTATSYLSVSLFEEARVVSTVMLQSKRQHGETLVQVVNDCLNYLGWTAQDIDQVIVGVGPGSYTGIRIGVTMAKMWATSLKVPLKQVSSLSLMAAGVAQEAGALIIPVIDARRQTAYTAAYEYVKGEGDQWRVQAVMADQQIEWQAFLEQLAELDVQRLLLVGDKIELFAEMARMRFEGKGIEVQWLDSHQAVPQTARVYHVEQVEVADPNLLVPNYAQTTLAEREWAQTHQVDEVDNENYIEHYS
ncbi:tRNA (adenosine(37)-N6)-threonylcarbamoyltransferase complex dimerization subunit type 1 TsaB [Fundicoccus culcitae]|uniref:tRNA (Adenosine(37)-N6)-threonylcarbamoyltransferase complex dimerization subunit type 1 TsaB n=1 Tax=Fundicoccus culcitae TaxID=2969821 RepID=A0ABY5P4L0_9LACT|nr:tRNA (adenosine(37)-N6)-threonylcarbamoyltransferase complex dimerization subunit type 1 TsaB [Fundicoccus culcitae]UUX33627.1 tRNA (adenosine(37)-N6)-threonylcarbamoyltransferase complex dimerization subunit type 1 TsaB [Fundicoccus culcitae]